MKIGARLISGFMLVLAMMVAVAGVGVYELRNVNEEVEDMIQNAVLVEGYAREVCSNVENFALTSRAMAVAASDANFQYYRRMLPQYTAKIDENLKLIDASENSAEEKALLDTAAKNRVVFRGIVAEIIKAHESGQKEKAVALVGDLEKAAGAYLGGFQAFRDFEGKLVKEAEQEVRNSYAFGRNVMVGLSVAAIIIGLFVAFTLTAGITRPLRRAVEIAETVAGGDLTSRIEVASTDETGQLMQAMKSMNESLLNTVSQVRESADTIASAATQITTGNQDLAVRTEQQVSSLEETASSMEEITSTVRQNGDNARQANNLAHQAADVATRGGEAAGRVADTMKDIEDSSRKIVDIISVIDGIAFQTNILALNAAVEAARAGEQGRGFAVVATEVRSLAQRSASAAREIKDLIDDSVHKVSAGTELVNNSVSTMLEIGDSIRQVNAIMNEITTATQEQIHGIEQINQAITEMDGASQQNASLVEESATAAASLQDQAHALVNVVSVFNTGSAGASRPAATRRATPASPKPVPKRSAPAKAASPARAAAPAPAKRLAAPVTSGDDNGEWEEF